MEKYKVINKIKHDIIKRMIFIPDIKIKTDQLKKTNNVCPISGWATNNNAIIKVIKKENKYLK